MTIEKLNENKLLISLYENDINGLLMDTDKMTMKNPEFKDAIKNILTLAVYETKINISNKKAIIEALPHESGCFLLISFIEMKSPPRKFRIKKPKTNIFSFKCLDDLINLAIQAEKNKISFPQNSMYEYRNKYYLATTRLDKNTEDLIKEFSDKSNKDYSDAAKNIARLEEYGTRITSGNAIKIIGKAMTTKNNNN